jgi:hypothetical protein
MVRTLRVIFFAFVLIGTMGAGTTILGSADGETPGTHIDVTQLKRISGNMVSLQFVLVNNTGTQIGMGGFMDGANNMQDNDTIAGVTLDDGSTKYVVVRDAQAKCVCSAHMGYLQPKTKINLWAKFLAPPTSITKLNVNVPHFPPINDVPLTPLSQ